MIERAWHYSSGQQSRGPVSTRQLVDLLRAGALPADTSVWTAGWAQWFPACDVEELAAAAWPAGVPAKTAVASLPPQPAPASRAASVASAGDAHPHSPRLAAIASALVPGAGQAYNGQPIKALFVLLSSVLLLPWAWGVWDARVVAGRIAAEGGRAGRGGAAWVLIQAWTAANLALFALLVATVGGWLR